MPRAKRAQFAGGRSRRGSLAEPMPDGLGDPGRLCQVRRPYTAGQSPESSTQRRGRLLASHKAIDGRLAANNIIAFSMAYRNKP